MPGLVEGVGEMVNRIIAVFSDENRKSLEQSLKNVEQVTKALAKNKDKAERTLDDLSQLATEISEISTSIKTFADNSDQRLELVTNELIDTLELTRETLTTVQAGTHSMTQSIASTSELIAHETASMSQSVAEAADALSVTAEDFENPKSLIVGHSRASLGPGERFFE